MVGVVVVVVEEEVAMGAGMTATVAGMMIVGALDVSAGGVTAAPRRLPGGGAAPAAAHPHAGPPHLSVPAPLCGRQWTAPPPRPAAEGETPAPLWTAPLFAVEPAAVALGPLKGPVTGLCLPGTRVRHQVRIRCLLPRSSPWMMSPR